MNWAQAKVAEYLEASMWLAPAGDKLTKEFNIDKYNPKNKKDCTEWKFINLQVT